MKKLKTIPSFTLPSSLYRRVGEPSYLAGVFIMKKSKEIWKDVPEFEGYYKVSSFGKIKSLERKVFRDNGKLHKTQQQKNLAQTESHKGYLMVGLSKNKETKTIVVHRLVGMAFVSNPKSKPQINHKDLNKKNNYYKNLEWVTNQENSIHAVKNGKTGYLKGEKSYCAKFSNKKAHKIKNEYVRRSLTKGIVALSKKYKTSTFCIWRIVSNKSYLK